MAIFDNLQYCKSSKRWVGGSKKSKKHDDVILEWSLKQTLILSKAIYVKQHLNHITEHFFPEMAETNMQITRFFMRIVDANPSVGKISYFGRNH